MMRVLLVDDERLMCTALKAVLEALDPTNEVIIFSGKDCAKKAMAWLADNTVDLCILDILLNGVSGLDIARHIKFISSDTPIIFITGCDSDVSIYSHVMEFSCQYKDVSVLQKRDNYNSNSFVDDLISLVVDGDQSLAAQV